MMYMIIGYFRRGVAMEGTFGISTPTEPSGLIHIGAWVDATLCRSFHVVECDNLATLQRWAARWRHRVEFEIVPIVRASEAVVALEPLLGS